MSGPAYTGITGPELVGLGDSVGIDRGPLLKRILDSIIPVAITQKFYGEKEGSQYGLTAAAPLDDHDRPCVEFWSLESDWAINRINAWWPIARATNVFPTIEAGWWYDLGFHMFTPDASYNPVENHPTGIFRPNLITNTPGEVGSVVAQGGGATAAYPRGVGYILHFGRERAGTWTSSGSAGGMPMNDSAMHPYYNYDDAKLRDTAQDKKCQNMIFNFDPPIRIRRHRVIDFALFGPDLTFLNMKDGFDLIVSIMYTELPNPRKSYFT